jgi:hypothetical protein
MKHFLDPFFLPQISLIKPKKQSHPNVPFRQAADRHEVPLAQVRGAERDGGSFYRRFIHGFVHLSQEESSKHF